jgi:hypothetical protein
VRVRLPVAFASPEALAELAARQAAAHAAAHAAAAERAGPALLTAPPTLAMTEAAPQPATAAADSMLHSSTEPAPASADAAEDAAAAAAAAAADGWDCDLPDVLLEGSAAAVPVPAADVALLPLLDRVRDAVGPTVPSSTPRQTALRAALLAFLDDDDETATAAKAKSAPSVPPSPAPAAASRDDAASPSRSSCSTLEDEGSLFDLKSLLEAPTSGAMALSPPSTVPRMGRRSVTTPERCTEAPRSASARSWSGSMRTSFEAVASGEALDLESFLMTTAP